MGFERKRIDTGFPNLGDDGIGGLGAAHVIDADIRARGTERRRDGTPDAGIGARHERLLTDKGPPRRRLIALIRLAHADRLSCGNLLV